LPEKTKFIFKLPEKIEIFRKFVGENRFFYPDPRPPRLQTRLTLLMIATHASVFTTWASAGILFKRTKFQIFGTGTYKGA